MRRPPPVHGVWRGCLSVGTCTCRDLVTSVLASRLETWKSIQGQHEKKHDCYNNYQNLSNTGVFGNEGINVLPLGLSLHSSARPSFLSLSLTHLDLWNMTTRYHDLIADLLAHSRISWAKKAIPSNGRWFDRAGWQQRALSCLFLPSQAK
jgi:hypothetical protein